jgi:hypothetical protein
MLRSLKVLRGYTVAATDGEMGKVYDFYFHDDTWVIRYLVADTGHWLPGRKVLVATSALGKADWSALTFPVELTREQVEKSPEIDTDKPVSRQQETDLYSHFGWPVYWLDPGTGAWPAVTPMTPIFAPPEPSEPVAKENADPHLRSAREVTGYHIHASDGALGHVEDFIAEDARWIIRYIVVHTGKWLPTKKVLISPEWLREIRYAEREVHVTLTRDKILNCPEFHPGAAVNREYEERLYDYYGRPIYWAATDPGTKANR